MNTITKFALPAALVAIILKMSYFIWLAPDESWDMYVRFGYLLVFLLALFLGLRDFKSTNKRSDFAKDVKEGMKVTSVFSIIVSSFTWLYYKWINPAYFENRIAELNSIPLMEEKQAENVKNTAEFIFNAFTHSTITLFGLMVLGFVYTLVLVMIMRAKPEVFTK